MSSLLINAALSAGTLIVGAFLYGMYQSARANIKLNLQGLSKSAAIEKAANFVVAAWYKSKEGDVRQRMSALAADALIGIGRTKKEVDFAIKASQIDYGARLRGQSQEKIALVSLVHFVLYHYSHFEPIKLSFRVESNQKDIDAALAAVNEAEKIYGENL